jgi:hypothetical protein
MAYAIFRVSKHTWERSAAGMGRHMPVIKAEQTKAGSDDGIRDFEGQQAQVGKVSRGHGETHAPDQGDTERRP